jgi:hypothetical protein
VIFPNTRRAFVILCAFAVKVVFFGLKWINFELRKNKKIFKYGGINYHWIKKLLMLNQNQMFKKSCGKNKLIIKKILSNLSIRYAFKLPFRILAKKKKN